GVHGALRASLRGEIADRLAASAIGVHVALDARAGRRIAELRPAVAALTVVGALRMALVIARPTRWRTRPAVGVRPTSFASPRHAERIARAAIAVADALD